MGALWLAYNLQTRDSTNVLILLGDGIFLEKKCAIGVL